MLFGPAIRISEVRIHELEGELEQRFGWSLSWTTRRHATLVEVRTDAGLTGWGDGGYGGRLLLDNPQLVIGRSPFEVEAIFESLRAPGGNQARTRSPTCGGLDVALWDLCGQALGVPVCRLLGHVYRDTVMPYCTALYRKDWLNLGAALAEEAAQWKARGYQAIKMKIGYGPETDAAVVRAVRDAIGEQTGLAVDSNCAYDTASALGLGRRLEEFHLMWWEEPLSADDFAGYRRLREALAIPLAGGETLAVDELILDYVQPRLVDILQPDIEHVGFSGGRRLSYLTWLHHLRLIPHNWGTAVRTASELHWAATIPPLTLGIYAPPVMIEFDRTEHPFRDAVNEERIDIDASGMLAVPQKPGLGVRVIPEAVAAFRRNLIVVR